MDGKPKTFRVGCCVVVSGTRAVNVLESNDTTVVGASGLGSVVGSVTSCYLLVIGNVEVWSCWTEPSFGYQEKVRLVSVKVSLKFCKFLWVVE